MGNFEGGPLSLLQITLVVHDLEATARVLRDAFGLRVAFRDPSVELWGLDNIVLPMGTTFIEVLSPKPGPKGDASPGARHMKRQGRVWIRIFPDVPVTQKPTEVRMGKGKGSVEYWAAKVKPGRVMFEIDGVSEDDANEAWPLAALRRPLECASVPRPAG